MNKIDKIFNTAKQTALTKEEKTSIFRNISSFMNSNPIINNFSKASQISPYVRMIAIVRLNYYKRFEALHLQILTKNTMIPLLLLLAALTGGTSFAANSALPGDALYPVKINLNENVESLLAVTPTTDAQVATKHAMLRLQEAKLLASTGKLTPEINNEIKNNFANDVKALATNLGDLKNNGNTKDLKDISNNFQKELKNNHKELASVATLATSTQPVVESLIRSLKGEDEGDNQDQENHHNKNQLSSTNVMTSATSSATSTQVTNGTSTVATTTTSVNTNVVPLFTTLANISKYSDDDDDNNDEENNDNHEDGFKNKINTSATSTLIGTSTKSFNKESNKHDESNKSSESRNKRDSEVKTNGVQNQELEND